MNRQSKRLQAKQEKVGKKPAQPARRPAPASQKQQKEKRKSFGMFLRDVRLELKKVQWPTRKETTAYSIVVLVTVVTMGAFVFVMDLVFSKMVLSIFGS